MSFTVTCSIGIALHPARRRLDGRAGAERRRRDAPRQGGRPRRLPAATSRARATATCARACASTMRCARRLEQRRLPAALPAADRSARAARWSAPRRCCAGPIPSSARSRRATSSRWPRRAASSCASATGCSSAPCGRPPPGARRGLLVPVSVNVSALQFQQHGFVQRVAAVLRAARLPAERLELELTESILLIDAGEALAAPAARSPSWACSLAIDDFGTGYSSLAYLKRFPIRRAEDRPQLRPRPARRGERRRHRPRDHPARPRAEAAGGGRRRRDRGAARLPRRRRLRPVPGLPVRAGAAERRVRAPPARLNPGPLPARSRVREIATTMSRDDVRRHPVMRAPLRRTKGWQ